MSNWRRLVRQGLFSGGRAGFGGSFRALRYGGGAFSPYMPTVTGRQRMYAAATGIGSPTSGGGQAGSMPMMFNVGLPGINLANYFGLPSAIPTQDYYQYDLPSQIRVVAPSGGDYTDIKTAIEACDPGDIVWVMAGTYPITSYITVPEDNISIIGSGWGSKISASTGSGGDALRTADADGVTIANLWFDMQANATGQFIDVADSLDLWVDRVKVTYATKPNYWLYVSNLSHRFCLTNSYIAAPSTYGITVINAYDALIANNIIENDTTGLADGCLYLQEGSDRCRVTGNVIRMLANNMTRMVRLYNTTDLVFCDNFLEFVNPGSSPNAVMVYCDDASYPVTRTVVKDNHITDPTAGLSGNGVYLGLSAGTVDDCQINGNVIDGFSVGVNIPSASINDTRVHDNDCHNCTTPVSDSGTGTDDKDNT